MAQFSFFCPFLPPFWRASIMTPQTDDLSWQKPCWAMKLLQLGKTRLYSEGSYICNIQSKTCGLTASLSIVVCLSKEASINQKKNMQAGDIYGINYESISDPGG